MASQARRQRRAYEIYLKKTDFPKYREWKDKVKERGRALFFSNREAVEKKEEEFYENMQTQLIQTLRDKGVEDSAIDQYIEDWVQTLKVWGSNEKPLKWKEVQRQKELKSETEESHD
jgi:hypothetical protein